MTDDRLNCPTTGEPCPYREHLPAMYGQDAKESIELSLSMLGAPLVLESTELPREWDPALDGKKLQVQLTEHKIAALALGCTGSTPEGECPTAERMAKSPVRQGTKRVLSYLGFNNGR